MGREPTDTRATAGCPIERALLVLDGKWSTLIIRELLSGPKRFGELRTALAIGSPKTLTERLRILEHQDVLTRTVHAEIPPRVVYTLTPMGASLIEPISVITDWAETHMPAITKAQAQYDAPA